MSSNESNKKSIYRVIDVSGKTIANGFTSRTEAKVFRKENQFVTRDVDHPLGLAKINNLSQKFKDVTTKDVTTGTKTIKKERTQ